MNIEEKKIDDVILLQLTGRIDAFTAEKLEEELDSIINSWKLKFVINFGQVNYISSSGLRVFLGAYKRLNDTGGKILFSKMTEPVLKVFSMAGFDKLFKIYSSDEDALQTLKTERKKAA